jgi:hypothetical protein
LAEAAGALAALRTAYRRRFVPPPTREQPEPPRDRLEALRALASLQERLLALETRVRSQPAPAQDSVWERFRREQILLDELLAHDYNLIAPSQALRDRARELTPEGWSEEAAAGLRQGADEVERALHARAELLQMPG